MRVRTVSSLAVLALVGGAYAPAQAAAPKKKKPITKTYDVTHAPFPDALEESACTTDRVEDVQKDIEALKVTGPGSLVVEVTGFVGDWDMGVFSTTGMSLGEGDGTAADDVPPNTGDLKEYGKFKIKKAQTLNIVVCNFAGSPDATVKYTFTYA